MSAVAPTPNCAAHSHSCKERTLGIRDRYGLKHQNPVGLDGPLLQLTHGADLPLDQRQRLEAASLATRATESDLARFQLAFSGRNSLTLWPPITVSGDMDNLNLQHGGDKPFILGVAKLLFDSHALGVERDDCRWAEVGESGRACKQPGFTLPISSRERHLGNAALAATGGGRKPESAGR